MPLKSHSAVSHEMKLNKSPLVTVSENQTKKTKKKAKKSAQSTVSASQSPTKYAATNKKHRSKSINDELEMKATPKKKVKIEPPLIHSKPASKLATKEPDLTPTVPPIINKDTTTNVANIITKHRVMSKISAPTNSKEDLDPGTFLRQKAVTAATMVKPVTEEKGRGDLSDKYPILKNQELVKRFLAVSITNNQKGRIRQVLREIFKGTSSTLLPDVINCRIQNILKSSENLTDTDLRKIRILYNMLKKATENQNYTLEMEFQEDDINAERKNDEKKLKQIEKSLGIMGEKKGGKKIKRYVLFIGNLPPSINKEQILDHFWELRDSVKDVRIPKRDGKKKSAIAYLELMNEPSYELALSKHHSMLGSRRINILFTTQKNGKITKQQAKSKSAKLQALVKRGQLLGSIPTNKKRSARRKKAKEAQKQNEAAAQKLAEARPQMMAEVRRAALSPPRR